MTKTTVSLLAGLALATSASAEINYSVAGSSYTQNFDTLANTGGANAWTNDSTLAGWSLFLGSPANTAAPTYATGTGSLRTFGAYGASGSADRALGSTAGSSNAGGYPTGTIATDADWGYVVFSATNNTGATLATLNIGYTAEQWGGGAADKLKFQYGYGATFSAVTTWTTVTAWEFDVTAASGSDTLISSANLGGTISGQSWTNGQTLWLRWVDPNANGSDSAIAIDDFHISAVPEPSTYGLMGAGALAAVALGRRRRRAK